jgi:PAS domain S-box-containing protein
LESVGKAFLVDPAHPKIIINSRDITDRQKLELEISKTSELYKKVVNTSPDAILTYTLDGIATFVSDVFLQMFGYQSSDELVGKSVFSLVSPKDRDRAALNTQKAIPLGGLKNIEYELVRKDGTTFIANVNALILRDNHGNPEGLIAVISDITESKKSQEAVKSHELLLRSVIDSVNAGIFIRDKFSTYLMVNQMFASFTGNKPEDFVGKNDADFVKMGIYTQQDADRIQSEEKKVWEGHETLNIKEESVIRKDGSTSWFQTQKSPIEVAGHGTCVLGVILDITSRKNDEEQLKIRNQELEKLNKVMVGREVRMMELKKEIAGLRSTG